MWHMLLLKIITKGLENVVSYAMYFIQIFRYVNEITNNELNNSFSILSYLKIIHNQIWWIVR